MSPRFLLATAVALSIAGCSAGAVASVPATPATFAPPTAAATLVATATPALLPTATPAPTDTPAPVPAVTTACATTFAPLLSALAGMETYLQTSRTETAYRTKVNSVGAVYDAAFAKVPPASSMTATAAQGWLDCVNLIAQPAEDSYNDYIKADPGVGRRSGRRCDDPRRLVGCVGVAGERPVADAD